MLFSKFEDTEIAFALLLREILPSSANADVWRVLEQFLLPLYPELARQAGEDLELGRQLRSLIVHEYRTFYPAFHASHHSEWETARARFAEEWNDEISPALAILDPDHTIHEVVIVLSPALRRHGKSYRVLDHVGRVAALLPRTGDDFEHALLTPFTRCAMEFRIL